MLPITSDNATIANNSVRSTSVSRGECSAISPSLRCAAQYGMARYARQSVGVRMAWVSVGSDARGVAVVTIDNQAKLNTLNTPVMTELIAVVERLGADETLRAVVLQFGAAHQNRAR